MCYLHFFFPLEGFKETDPIDSTLKKRTSSPTRFHWRQGEEKGREAVSPSASNNDVAFINKGEQQHCSQQKERVRTPCLPLVEQQY